MQIEARSSLHPINARTNGLEGFVELEVRGGGKVNLAVAPSGRLSLPVGLLQSGNRLEDRELQKRIEARRFPTIDGVLTSMAPSGSDGGYRVRGDVSFRGVTRSCEDDMAVGLIDGDTLRLQGRSTFDIRDFGMQPPRILMLKVEPEVVVKVDIIAEEER